MNETPMEKAAATLVKRNGKQNTAVRAVKDILERAMPEVRNALPRHMTPERMIRIAFSAISRSPLLLQCDPMSLAKSVIESSELGLEPSGILGHSYLVPYKNNKTGRYEAQLQIGYRGYIELASRSGRVRSISAEVVYEGDEFDFCRGTEDYLRHKPNLARTEDAVPLCAYAVVHYRDGGCNFEVVPICKIDQARRASKTRDRKDSPWVLYPEEMMRKTAIRRLAKYLQLSPELQTTAIRDEYREAGVSVAAAEGIELPEMIDVTDEETTAPPAEEREPGQEG